MEADNLLNSLALIYSRLERILSANACKRFWNNQIAWHIGGVQLDSEKVVARWTVDDRICFLSGKESIELVRFLGNQGDARCGWGEVKSDLGITPRVHERFLELANIMHDGVVETKSLLDKRIRLSSLVRTFFLNELIVVAKQFPGGLSSVMQTLKQGSWGGISEDSFWEHFLRTRKSAYRFQQEIVDILGVKIPGNVWNIGIWKEVKEICRVPDQTQDFWNPAFTNKHFALFVSVVYEILMQHQLMGQRSDCDVYLCELLGFPKNFGTPRHFLNCYTKVRAAKYAQRFWPNYYEAFMSGAKS